MKRIISFLLALLGLWILIVPDYSNAGLIIGGLFIWASLRIK